MGHPAEASGSAPRRDGTHTTEATDAATQSAAQRTAARWKPVVRRSGSTSPAEPRQSGSPWHRGHPQQPRQPGHGVVHARGQTRALGADRVEHRDGERRNRHREPQAEEQRSREDRRPPDPWPEQDEAQEAARRDQRAQRHGPPSAARLSPPSGERRQPEHQQGDRQQAQPRAHRREPQGELQLQHQQEDGAAQRGVEQQGHAVGRREGGVPEEREGHHRLRAALEKEKGHEPHRPAPRREKREVAPAVRRSLDQREGQATHRERSRGRAGQVERSRIAGGRRVGKPAPRRPERDGGERQVQEEDAAPADGLDQPPSHERARGRAHPRQTGPEPERRALVGLVDLRPDQGQAQRDEERRRQPLESPGQREREDTRRQRAQQRGRGEPQHAELEHRLAAQPVPEAPADEEKGAEGQEIGIERPLQPGEVRSERPSERRQGHVHRRRVEERHP